MKERKELVKVKELILDIKRKYNLTSDDLRGLIEEISLPVDIFNEKLTVLESVVKYLKEEKGISLHNIADLTKRDERNVWGIYDKSNKKYPKRLIIKKSEL